jgi:hypothetical protein
VRLILDWFAAGLFLISGKPADAKAVFSAHLDFFKNLSADLHKRRILASKLGGFRVKGVYRNLLPLQYFLFKRKTYGNLK